MTSMKGKTVTENKLLQAMHEFLALYGTERTYWIAFSGGLDSRVLLSLCHSLNLGEYKWHAIYVDHGLNLNALAWGDACARICKDLGIPFTARSIKVLHQKGESLENLARDARYALFSEYIKSNDMLLTAHQEDDQAETVLMQLIRGSGLKGLSAMPMVRPFALGFHGRPLLNLPRSLLKQYAAEKKLNWIEDGSNQNEKHTRNFIRHQILPLLKQRFPSVTQTLSRVATHCAKAEQFINKSLHKLSPDLNCRNQTLSVSKLLLEDIDHQKFILRQWIEHQNFRMPSEKKINAVLQNVLCAGWDKNPCVKWESVELRRYRDHLFLQQTMPKFDETAIFIWDFQRPLKLPGLGTLHVVETKGGGYRPDINKVVVKFRLGGEVVLLHNRTHHALKKIFQEKGIPPWERSRIPLIFIDTKMIGMVGDIFDDIFDDNYCVKENEIGLKIYLEK
jgi:tRNA(Ile)-lysidine synthase